MKTSEQENMKIHQLSNLVRIVLDYLVECIVLDGIAPEYLVDKFTTWALTMPMVLKLFR